jgi:phage repressor protein C with HTH and peptisase S24 domain
MSKLGIFGTRLRSFREKVLVMTRPEVARITSTSERTIARYEEPGMYGVPGAFIRALAEAAGKPFEEVRSHLQQDLNGVTVLEPGEELPENIQTEPAPAEKEEPIFDQNIELGSKRVLDAEIPMFDMSVACGHWVQIEELAEVCDPRQIDQGLFRIRLSGDSMKPKYNSGDVVEFKCLRYGRDELEIGKDYYVQLEDGLATFKRLENLDDQSITLRAINKRKYPDIMPVHRAVIVRMALALWILKSAQ